MNPNKTYITEEKRKELSKELEMLKTEKRREILEALEFAKSLGDLSENAEYHQAREEQAKLEERISMIEEILRSAQILKKHHSTVVEVGSTVTVHDNVFHDNHVALRHKHAGQVHMDAYNNLFVDNAVGFSPLASLIEIVECRGECERGQRVRNTGRIRKTERGDARPGLHEK